MYLRKRRIPHLCIPQHLICSILRCPAKCPCCAARPSDWLIWRRGSPPAVRRPRACPASAMAGSPGPCRRGVRSSRHSTGVDRCCFMTRRQALGAGAILHTLPPLTLDTCAKSPISSKIRHLLVPRQPVFAYAKGSGACTST